MLPQLPQDILIEVLVLLPVKSLLRFRAVSRSWNSLIKSKTFISHHLIRSAKASDSKILLKHYDHTRNLEIYSFYRDDGKCLTEDQVLEFPIENNHYSHVGTCNGLLCFRDHSTDYLNIVLWNPSVRTRFQVPFPRIIDLSDTCVVGLGLDCWTNQYKILRLIYVQSRRHMCMKKLEVEVFVLGTGKWRRLDTHIPLMALCYLEPYQAYLHGAIHWVGHRSNNSAVIIVFDVHGEVFQEIEIPSIIRPKNCSLSLTVCVESLYLRELDPGPAGETSRVFIWVMKKYVMKESWTKLFRIDSLDQWGINTVMGFQNNGKLLVQNDRKGLFSYDSRSGRANQLRIHGKNDEILFPKDNKELNSYDPDNGMVEEPGLPQYYKAIPHKDCLVLLEERMQ